MSDQVVTVTVKGVGDFSDVVNNVGSVQKALTKLKLPDKLGDNLNKNITAFYKEYEKYQQKIAGGLKTQGDYNQVEKSLNTMRNLYQAIGADAQKLLKLDMKDLLNLDTGEFKKISNDITNIMKQIGNVKIDTTPFTKAINDIRGVTKNSKISGEDGLLNKILGSINSGQISEAKKALQELKNYADKVAPRETASGGRMPGTLNPDKYNQLTNAINVMNGAVAQAEATIDPLIQKQNDLQRELEETKQKAASGIEKEFKGYNEASKDVERVTDSLKRMHQEEFSFNREAQNIDRQIQSYFGLSQMIRKVGDIARDAFATVKELDAAMTQTAVVTNFSVGDMWDMLPTYTAQANQLGSTIKDVYEAATLYYQQGLNTNQAMGLANETLKMARIAGLGAAEATDMMTAALRGFNMEINQQSAQKINDIYSELAAITASDTAEIGSAMERTASIANSANMEFATTSAFLAQMIETTREAPENLGTAMKTIIARFQEMKQDPTKLIDSEGVAMDANKVDKALKTIGVNLMNTKGEFRDLDDVFLDISQRWDSLTQGQQRYIATIAAGSRQQSRFIAMMSNYERTMELVDAANNSAGASQRQFEKTLDSMEAKLNKLKNAWDQFTMGLMNNQILKFGVDALTKGFTVVNKFIDVLGKIPPKPFEGVTKSILTLVTTLGMLNFGKKASRGLVMAGAGWWKGEGKFGQNFMSGWSNGKQGALAGRIDGKAYVSALKAELANKNGIGNAIRNAYQIGSKGVEAFENTFQGAFGQFTAKEISAAWSPQIESEIRNAFARATANVDLTQYGIEDGNEYVEGMLSRARDGINSLGEEANILKLKTGGKVDLASTGVNKLPNKEFEQLNSSISRTGQTLQQFGFILQQTPLAPVGAVISTIGTAFLSLGTAITTASNSFMIGMGKVVAAEGMGVTMTKMLAGGFKQLWIDMGPVGWAILAITALASAYMLLKDKIPTKGNQLTWVTDAAAAASEAYDSAKQETSELADAIAQIEETDSAFDNLVAGTAEFNEQLITANEQISELIDKYPMLNDPQYLSTDKNGRMRINQAGLDAVKDYQKQIQANASAMNLIQTADLNAVENQQKADELRKVKGDMTQEEHEKNLRDADLLEQRIQAEKELARQNAIRVSLADKEIHNAETMSKIMADQYETKKESAKLDVEAMDKHERRQAYADFHGYTYNKSTKKITDVEGNEIDYDDKTIKDEVIEQQVILEFQEDAESLERALASVNSKFASGLEEQTAGSAHVISDILSSNIETDEEILRKVLSEPNQLQNLVNNLSEAEMAAILGISASSITDTNINKYKQDIVNKLTDKAENIAEAQAESYAELGTMIAKAQGNILDKNGKLLGQQGKTSKEIEQSIAEQIDNLKPEYAHLMSSVGSKLQEFAGEDTMATFVNEAYKIYTAKGENAGKTINELNKLIDNTNFDSAISRLTFYNKAMQSSNTRIQEIGKSMKSTTGEANLLGQAFDEFLGSSDWAELSENTDDFKNALGEYDAAGIQKAAEQSRTLNELLDSGAISAGGVAAALQGMDDGTITNLNSTVLTLLSSFNRLADAASEAHKIIEGFDPGIDTGEGEDFVKENAEKFKEYYDNGEFGNEQLQNYIKLAAGTDKWNEALRENGGDLREAAKDLKHYVTAFDEGFVSVYDKLTQGLDLKGNKISDEVQKEFEGLEFLWDENGELQINLADFGTEDLQAYLQKALGISEEYAKLMLQNLSNYDTQLSSQLRANDIKKSLSDKDFQTAHQDSQGRFILSDSDIRAVGASLDLENDINTSEGLEEATRALAELAGAELEVFKTQNEDGSQREDYGNLLADYAQTFYGQKVEDLFGVQELQQGGKFDVGKLVNDSIAKGMDSNQASQVAYEAIQKANAEGITDLLYNGQLLDLSQITSYEDFLAATQKLTDSAQWYEVGQSIAEGIISYIEGKDNNSEQTNQTPTSTNSDNKPKQPETKPAGMPSSDWNRYQNGGVETSTAKWENYVPGWLASAIKAVKTESDARTEQNTETNGPTAEDVRARNKQWWSDFFSEGEHAAEARSQKTSGGQGEIPQQPTETSNTNTELTTAAQSLSTTSEALNTAVTSLTTAGETLNTAGQNLTNAAAVLATNNPPQGNMRGPSSPPGMPSNVPQPQAQQSSVSGAIVVDNSAALASLDEVKAKAEEAKSTIDAGATFDVKVTGDKKLHNAAQDAASLTSKNGSSASIAVSTGAVNKDSVNQSISEINKSKATILVDANTQAAIQKARAAANTMDSYSATIDVEARVRKTGISSITVEGKTVNITARASGVNNHGYASAPKAGSAARGSYGQVGPKGKGGLTLTGELGYEIAWLPSENRSMILGANGPQMVDLPGDAVVWTHEQSKQIMKQKAIPAGSHGNTSIKKPGGTGGGGKKDTKKKSSGGNNSSGTNNSNLDVIIEKAGKVSVWWENMARRIEATQRKVDKNQKKFETLLKTFGKTAQTATSVANNYKKSLKKSIILNQAEVKKANQELKSLDKKGKTSISYEVKKNGKKTTKKSSVNLGNYIKEYDGTYIIDQKALNKVANKNKSKAEAIKSAAEQKLNDKLGKKNKAEDEIAKAQEALDKIADDIYTTFYQWENSLNKVYFLSKRLSDLSNQMNVRESQSSLLSAKALAGFGGDISALSKVLTQEKDLMVEQVTANQQNLAASKKAYDDSLKLSTYVKRYQKAPDSKEAQADFKAAQWALKFLESGGKFDESKIAELESKGYTADTIERIKKVIEDIDQKRSDAMNAAAESNNAVAAIYSKITEYQDYISDFESELLSGLEEQTEKEINKLDKINSSLTKAYKELLDEVKRALDERRKKEDNAKTESDISKKQQRLALLQADTSGGHATEIAQLEKEISEAQQNYQRSLEDQLIEKLQNQGDKAEKQRQKQIDLLNIQKDIAKKTGSNLAEVQKWLNDWQQTGDKQAYENIRNTWLANHGYDEATDNEKRNLERQFDEAWMKYGAYSLKIPELQKEAEKLDENTAAIQNLTEAIIGNANPLYGWKAFKDAGGSAKQAKELGATAEKLKNAGYSEKSIFNAGYSKSELSKAGFDATSLTKAGITAKQLRSRGYGFKEVQKAGKYSGAEMAKAGYTAAEFKKAGYSAKQTAKFFKDAGFSAQQISDKIAKGYGKNALTTTNMVTGKSVQTQTGASAASILKIINKDKNDKATRSDLAGVTDEMDINGKKKGGKKTGTISKSGTQIAVNKGSTLYVQGWNGKSKGKQKTYTIDKLTVNLLKKHEKEAKDALIYAIQHKKPGSLINKKMKDLINQAGLKGKTYKLQNGITGSIGKDGKIYYNKGKEGVNIWDAAAGKTKLDKYTKKDKKRFQKLAKTDKIIGREYAQILKKRGVKYATGGLADYTGPAWLDGTPSKPELVLNAQDTKNFIALKDVLSKAIGSTGAVENTYGNATYEININVDHLNNDYDVDKVVERVKKKIVQDSSYRNVTQVRKFR